MGCRALAVCMSSMHVMPLLAGWHKHVQLATTNNVACVRNGASRSADAIAGMEIDRFASLGAYGRTMLG
jgi:hypothetical protein